MEKMATNKTQNKSLPLKMGQLWTQVDDNLTADEEETEEEDDMNKDNNETMKLRREDMSLFGICPAWDQFYLVVCEYCKQVIKPQALQQHIELRHSYHKHISNKQINNSSKLRTDSTNTTTIMPSIRRTSSTTSTIVAANGSDINSNNDNNNKLVNKVTKSDVKVMLSSTNSAKSVDNKTNSLNNNSVVVVVDNSVDTNCVESSNEVNTKPNSKLINLLSPNISTTTEPLVPEPTGPGPGFTPLVSADINSVTISVPEIDLNNRIEIETKETDLAIVAKPAAKKKSYKKSTNPRKLLPCKDRLYDPNKHCGVCVPDIDKPCTRSLTCKTHSLTLRRAVKGRIKNFDELLSEHREAKEAALRAQGIEVKPTKKSIQRQQQQLRASQLQLKVEPNQQLVSSSNSSSSDKPNCQPISRTLSMSDSQSVVSNATTNSNTNSLLTLVTSPVCSSIENVRTCEPEVLPKQTHLKLQQIEVDSNGSVFMRCHPIPAAVCNFNIRTLGQSRLLSRSHDHTLAALRSTFSSAVSTLSVSKFTTNQKCSSTPLSVKSPLRNPNQSHSPNKKLCTSVASIDSESYDSWTDSMADPYNFADGLTSNSNISFTYVKPKTKTASTPSKKKKKSDSNCLTDNSSLLSNGQLFNPSNANKPLGSTAKKKSLVKKNANNSHSISATIPLTISNNNIISSTNSTNSNCEQVINPSTSLISEVPNVQHRNQNEFLSNSIDSCKSDNGSILLNGSLLNSCRRSTFTAHSKPTNSDSKDSINKKTIFSAKSFNNNNKYLVNSLSPTLSSISSALSVNPNTRQLIQKQTLPSSAVNTLSQSQNMSQISPNIHNTTHTIFIKSTKQSLQNQLIPTINSPKLLSKSEDYTT